MITCILAGFQQTFQGVQNLIGLFATSMFIAVQLQLSNQPRDNKWKRFLHQESLGYDFTDTKQAGASGPQSAV